MSNILSLDLPCQEEQVLSLKVGDTLRLSGTLVTGRDRLHKYLTESFRSELKSLLEGSFLYHCGPVVSYKNGKYDFISAGPTTSIREEPYQAKVIHEYGIRGVIGKGGMGGKTLEALSKYKAVYCHAIGGAASLLATHVTKVKEVLFLEEFGVPEALWVIEVKEFPVTVTMDSNQQSLHERTQKNSNEKRLKFIKGL